MSRFSVEYFLSRIIEEFRLGTLLCFTNFLVSKKFMEKRRGGREGGSMKTSHQNVMSPVSKNFVGGSFRASFNSGIENCQV